MVNALYDKVATFIRWPTLEESQQSMEIVQRNYGFPGVIGAIDGTHVKIIAPRKDSDSYINRKGFHSIQLQVGLMILFIHFNIDTIFTFLCALIAHVYVYSIYNISVS